MLAVQTINFNIFEQVQGLLCAFSTRHGGQSLGPYASFNLGLTTGDDPESVKTNRRRFFKKLQIDPERIVFPGQVHSGGGNIVDQPGFYSQTDALITQMPELYLSIQTADCFPVFIVHPQPRTVAVIHAGWRGVVNRILENTLDLLLDNMQVSVSNLLVAVGPGICQNCFEVGPEVYDHIPAEHLHPHPKAGKRYFDLVSFMQSIMIAYGIHRGNIEVSSECTHCRDDRYYSYRRDGQKSGRMMGIIGYRE